MALEWPPDPKGPGQLSFENIPRFGPKIGTLGTPGGSHGTNFFSSKIFSLKNIWVYKEKFMDLLSKKMICWQKSDISSRMEIRAKIWVFLLQKSSFCQKTPKPYYMDLNIDVREYFWRKKFGPMGPPGVPRVPILGPNRGMFSKLNWPGPLGSGGHSHTIFSNGRFQGAQRSFGGDVLCSHLKSRHTNCTPLLLQ